MYAQCSRELLALDLAGGAVDPYAAPKPGSLGSENDPDMAQLVVVSELSPVTRATVAAKRSLLSMQQLVQAASGEVAAGQYAQVIRQLSPLAFPDNEDKNQAAGGGVRLDAGVINVANSCVQSAVLIRTFLFYNPP